MALDLVPALLRTSAPWRDISAAHAREAVPAEHVQPGVALEAFHTQMHLLSTPTPYGSVLKDIKMQNKDGSEFNVLLCRPKAFLWLAVRMSPAFEHFLRENLPGNASRVTFYMDDVRPGNQLKPDMGRVYDAW